MGWLRCGLRLFSWKVARRRQAEKKGACFQRPPDALDTTPPQTGKTVPAPGTEDTSTTGRVESGGGGTCKSATCSDYFHDKGMYTVGGGGIGYTVPTGGQTSKPNEQASSLCSRRTPTHRTRATPPEKTNTRASRHVMAKRQCNPHSPRHGPASHPGRYPKAPTRPSSRQTRPPCPLSAPPPPALPLAARPRPALPWPA